MRDNIRKLSNWFISKKSCHSLKEFISREREVSIRKFVKAQFGQFLFAHLCLGEIRDDLGDLLHILLGADRYAEEAFAGHIAPA